MHVDAIPIPAATQTASTATMPPSSASFSATLASSMSSSAPEHSTPEPAKGQSAAAETTSKSASKSGANFGTKSGLPLLSKFDPNIDSKSSSNTAPNRGAKAKLSLRSLVLKSESAGEPGTKSEAKAAVDSTTVPGITPSLPSSLLVTANAPLLATLLTAPPATPLVTLPTTSPTASKTTPAPALADPHSNQQQLASDQQPLARQLTANRASVTASPPLPIRQPGGVPAQIAVPGVLLSSNMADALYPHDRRDKNPQGQTSTSAVPLAAISRAAALPISNSTTPLDAALRASSGVAEAAMNSPVTAEAILKSPELPSPAGQAASGVAHSFSNVPTQSPTAPTQFSTPPASASPAPTGLVSSAPISPATVLLTPVPMPALPATTQAELPTAPVSISPATTASPMPTSVGSQFHARIPTSAAIFALDKTQTVQSPTVPAAPLTPAPPVPVTLLAKAMPSPLSGNSSDQSAPSAPVSGFATLDTVPSQVLRSDATTTAAPQAASASEAGFAIAPNLTNIITNNTANHIPNNNAPLFTPNLTPNSKALAPAPVSIASTPIAPTKHDAPISGKSGVSVQPGPAAAPQTAATAAAKTVSAPETGFVIADDRATNVANDVRNNAPSFTSNLTPNSNVPAPTPVTPAPIAATTNDASRNAKPGISVQPASAATPQTAAADKKASAAVQGNVQPQATPSHDVPSAALDSGNNSSATPAPAPPASAPPPQVRSDAAPELPKTHHMLDSAPPTPTAPPVPIAPGSAADLQMNAQMQVGIRTDAFGAVQIHTVVQQSQVGITIHGDRDLARWFSSEVPSLESGLNHQHLNLTAVDFDNGRSGVQTATSFQHGQPRQHFSETPGSQSAVSPEQDPAPEPATISILPSDLTAGPAKTRVSIHV